MMNDPTLAGVFNLLTATVVVNKLTSYTTWQQLDNQSIHNGHAFHVFT